tara:strand:+ start:30 stop:512 length:483 start_codon:yes stop_codon:yes gene_type:complete
VKILDLGFSVKSIIIDKFLTPEECQFAIKYYENHKKDAQKFRDVFPLILFDNIPFLNIKLNKVAKEFNSQIDWLQIVKWPIGSHQDFHFDKASDKTTLSSIVYLNDEFEGGQTYFEEGTIFKPKIGRGLFFNGQYYKHGVLPVQNHTRYVVATWYKSRKT